MFDRTVWGGIREHISYEHTQRTPELDRRLGMGQLGEGIPTAELMLCGLATETATVIGEVTLELALPYAAISTDSTSAQERNRAGVTTRWTL